MHPVYDDRGWLVLAYCLDHHRLLVAGPGDVAPDAGPAPEGLLTSVTEVKCPACGKASRIIAIDCGSDLAGHVCLNRQCQHQFLATKAGIVVTVSFDPLPPKPAEGETWRDRAIRDPTFTKP